MGRKLHYHQCFSLSGNEKYADVGVKPLASLAGGE